MRRLKKKNIGYKKERVVLADILPYEVPPFFSNSSFYQFLIKNKIHLVEKEAPYRKVQLRFAKESTGVLAKIVRIVFGVKKGVLLNTDGDYHYFNFKSLHTIPFTFRVAHKKNDFRKLTVIHPLNQLSLIDFYDKYKYNIINFTTKSKYSLRTPTKISSLKYFKDTTNKKLRSKTQEIEIIETSNKEYTSLKSYFSYQRYSNINQFYESYEYQKAEKRFDNLMKFDISKCFDSIYSHTLPWALMNKKIVKDNVLSKEFKNNFGNRFDVLMQKMNYNETNGIIIGSEFSRIFAELILQKIDVNVERELEKKGLRYKHDFDIYRYVDDYFVFYSKDSVKDIILNFYKLKLHEYNMSFNDSKTDVINKPIITNITMAKEQIRELVEKTMFLRFYDIEEKGQLGVKYYSAKDLITNYKKTLALTNTSYKDLQNYFLAIIFNKLKDLIKKYEGVQGNLLNKIFKKNSLEIEVKGGGGKEAKAKLFELKQVLDEKSKEIKVLHNQLYKNFKEIIELTFFVYSVLPKVTFSIKVSHIIFRIIDFIKNQESTKQAYISKLEGEAKSELEYIAFDFDKKHILFKSIYDNISTIFKKNNASQHAEVETLYLLQISGELGKYYKLKESLLIEHFNILDENLESNLSLNYFTIVSLLSYIKRDSDYDYLREKLRQIIFNYFIGYEYNSAENTFLLIDVLTCPYLDKDDDKVIEFRRKILEEIKFFNQGESEIAKNQTIEDIYDYCPTWFFRWVDNDLGIELNTKRGHLVY
ncbi:antiviral reverse transcriptase Drt3b [Muricauda sp. ANG21]|uniref:antiviral reverse transcriptase Drt3b n=1 Tax=Allomuricauda sp. ANG21 TaxID=3042468 RepID=UPI00345123BD